MNPNALMMIPSVDRIPIRLWGKSTDLSQEMPKRTPPSLQMTVAPETNIRQTMKAITRAKRPRDETLTRRLDMRRVGGMHVGFLRMEVIQQKKRRMIVGRMRLVLALAIWLKGGRSERKSVMRIIVPMSEPQSVISVQTRTSQYPAFPK